MGQRARILTQIAGFRGWKVAEAYWKSTSGGPLTPVAGYDVPADALLVLRLERRWAPRCGQCFAILPSSRRHQRCATRRWRDLSWAGHQVVLEYAPDRYKCACCGACVTELLAWADPKQRQSRRLQQHLALDAFSMPLSHVATKYGLSWHTVRRAESDAIARWERCRPAKDLRLVGIDEKWLGRRHKLEHKFITIVSDLDSGEPVWIGYGRGEATLASWFKTLSSEQKAKIDLFACDMWEPFKTAIRADPEFAHAAIVHDPFHVMKRAGEAITELRRQIFFRGSAEFRAVGRGTRWLVLRPWERLGNQDRTRLRRMFALNGKLARAYQTVEQLREALRAPDELAMADALWAVLRRLARRDNVPMRKLRDSLVSHRDEILALARFRPPTGRIEALNGNWETMVRRGRGYRDHAYLLRKLRFLTANPVRDSAGIKRFLALGLIPPIRAAA
jgi:transposase